MRATFVGIDPSYTGLACVALEGDRVLRKTFETKPKDFKHRIARLVHLRNCVERFVDEVQPHLICIEGYSFGSKFGREQAGELGGVLRCALFEGGFEFVSVPIPSLKSFVTGKGNADKSVMMREVFRKWGYEAEDDNDNDAFALARLAMDLSSPEKTKKLRELVKKFEWIGGA
jgi:Holliday junction resolvasome RuvABC endonuclease subunit